MYFIKKIFYKLLKVSPLHYSLIEDGLTITKSSFFYTRIIILLILLITSCTDPYSIPVSSDKVNLLVVDGYLNSSNNSALVKLSRAIPLSESNLYPTEGSAKVSINDEHGVEFNLTESDPGTYSITGLDIKTTNKYQLKIKTTDGNEYASDYIELKIAPPIDSVTWKPGPTGISLYVNSHDPTGNTRFYQWQYKETWEYKSDYPSSYFLIDGEIYPRLPEDDIYTCWNTELSSNILVQSNIKLTQDVIRDFPLTSIERGSKKLSRTYSILVQQKALTEQAYTFLEQLRNTNESLGGLFGALPSEVIGNIHNSKSSESVLGYFGGGSIQEKRIFIEFNDLPDYLLYVPRSSCQLDSIPLNKLKEYPNSTLIVAGYGFVLEGYLTSTTGCIDCRYAGGTTTKPDFWPR